MFIRLMRRDGRDVLLVHGEILVRDVERFETVST